MRRKHGHAGYPEDFRGGCTSLSTVNSVPLISTATPVGFFSVAETAGPPSPLKFGVPVPATVLIAALEVTFRIRLFPASAMKTLFALSIATPVGLESRAAE